MANSTKTALESQTIQGAIKIFIPLIVLILQFFGVDITPEESGQLTDRLITLVAILITIWGQVQVIIGRLNATQPISGFLKIRK